MKYVFLLAGMFIATGTILGLQDQLPDHLETRDRAPEVIVAIDADGRPIGYGDEDEIEFFAPGYLYVLEVYDCANKTTMSHFQRELYVNIGDKISREGLVRRNL